MAAIISRSEAGSEVSPTLAGIGGAHGGSANYIVGQYNDDGVRVRRGVNAGGTDVNSEAYRRMERILMKHGERMQILTTPPPQPMVVAPQAAQAKGKKGKKSKAVKVAAQAPIEEPSNLPLPPYVTKLAPPPVAEAPARLAPSQNMVVVFNTGFGKIKAVVDAVLENDGGLGLIFGNDNEVRFTPNQGDEFQLGLPDGRSVGVFYLGLTFNWYNSPQQIMLFYKTT